MRSIEDLTDEVRTRAGRRQFDEAMRAYSAGAYKAATIALWIAVLQDLTDKLRILADSGDKAATKLIGEVNAARDGDAVRKMQAIENTLLHRACTEFELVTSREAQELERLNQDRNICAHPSFHDDLDAYEMSAEQVRAYACLVVDAVLSQPPIVGKALIERFQNDTESDSWPDDNLADFLRARYFDRARSGMKRNILAVAVKAAIRPPDDADDRVPDRCTAALRAAAEIDEPLLEDTIGDVLTKWRDHLTDDELMHVVGSVGNSTVTWLTLGQENVTRAGNLLRTADVERLIRERVFSSGTPAHHSLADDYAVAISRLGTERLAEMVRRPYPSGQWVGSILDELDRVRSWRRGEHVMRMVLAVAGELSIEDLSRIGNAFATNDQINRAFNMPQLIARLVEATAWTQQSREIWDDILQKFDQAQNDATVPVESEDYSEARELLSGTTEQR